MTGKIAETYQILEHLKAGVEVEENPYHFELDQLFKMAARLNKKRSFLFVSRLLGKHLAVEPQIPLLTGALLAMRYMEVVHGYKDSRAEETARAIQTKTGLEKMLASLEISPIPLPAPAVFIGFAETATALGHSVFHAFASNGKYIHTSREEMTNLESVIDFEEEHSHAVDHKVYALDPAFFQTDAEVILIDDEVTTGKTAINIIRTIKERHPAKKVFSVLSILDWRSDENRERYRALEEELHITIHDISLVSGKMDVQGSPLLQEEEREETTADFPQEVHFFSLEGVLVEKESFIEGVSVNANLEENALPYLRMTGRFGVLSRENREMNMLAKRLGTLLKAKRKGKKTLVIGTGEFMYIPMRLAAEMGEGVFFQSTTRSPIFPVNAEDYTIQNKFSFDSLENPGLVNHLYNIFEKSYDEIFIMAERLQSFQCAGELLEELKRTKIPCIHVVSFCSPND